MSLALKLKKNAEAHDQRVDQTSGLASFVPAGIYPPNDPQTDIPPIAKDREIVKLIESAVRRVPTTHRLILGDARAMDKLGAANVHSLITRPPYSTRKE